MHFGNIKPIQVENKKTDEDNEEPEYSSAMGNMVNTIKQMTINKLKSNSGEERAKGEEIGFSMYAKYPIFGLGFCSYRTFNLFTNILVNTGVVGILAYLYIIFVVLKELIKSRKRDEIGNVMFFISIVRNNNSVFRRSSRFSIYVLLVNNSIRL